MFESRLNTPHNLNIKNGFYCCYVRCVTFTFGVEGIPLSKTGATHYYVQLGLTGKGRAIKELNLF